MNKTIILICIALIGSLAACIPVPTVEVVIPTITGQDQIPDISATSTLIPVTNTPSDTEEPTREPTPTLTPDFIINEATDTSVPDEVDEPIILSEPVTGIEMHQITSSGGLNLVENAGARWIRRNALFWSQVEPSPGERRWEALANLEIELKNAFEAGLETILIVRSTPRWAQKLPWVYCGPVAEEAIDVFAQFMFDLVERYSVPPYNVLYWEIGNEPDIDPKNVKNNEIYGCWGDEQEDFYGGEYYSKVLEAVYPRVKEANPAAQVLLGGLLLECDPRNPPTIQGTKRDCSASNFFEGILRSGGGDYFDGVSFHAYDYYYGDEGVYKNINWYGSYDTTGPVLVVKTAYIRELLEKYNVEGKYLMNTESAVLCGSTGKEHTCLTDEFKNTKAYYAAQSNAAAVANGLSTNIWYSIYGWRASGLAITSTIPTSALQAFQVSSELLSGSGFRRSLNEFPGILGYVFEKDNKTWWILWSISETDQEISLPEIPAEIINVFGEEILPQSELQIGRMPLYLFFP